MLELDPDGRMPADAHADRMAIALRAFAEEARDAVGEARERLQLLDGAIQLRVLVRMADDDYFWASVDQPLAARFQALLDAPITVAPWDPLPLEVALRLALVGSAYARERLPGLSVRFDQLGDYHQQQVIAARPSGFFLPKVIELLRTAGTGIDHEERPGAPHLEVKTVQKGKPKQLIRGDVNQLLGEPPHQGQVHEPAVALQPTQHQRPPRLLPVDRVPVVASRRGVPEGGPVRRRPHLRQLGTRLIYR